MQNHSFLLRWLWLLLAEPTSLWSERLRMHLGLTSINDLSNLTGPLTFFIKDLISLVPLFKACTRTTDHPPQLLWMKTSNGIYSSKSAYDFFINPGVQPPYPYIPWKLHLPNKIKIFLWLMMQNKLLTNENLQKRNWPCGASCVLCNSIMQETTDHIFLSCSFTRRTWNDILPNNHQLPSSVIYLSRTLDAGRLANSGVAIKYAAVCWNIWKERNRRIFENKMLTSYSLTMKMILDVELWQKLGAMSILEEF
jgi:zinc-binding in reverse transcriptase